MNRENESSNLLMAQECGQMFYTKQNEAKNSLRKKIGQKEAKYTIYKKLL